MFRPFVASLVVITACGPELEAEPLDSVSDDLGAPVTTSFQNGTAGYAGTTDTTLEENTPSTNFGNDVSVRVDRDSPEASRQSVVGLLRFDVAGIAKGSVVQSVKLTLNVTNRSTAANQLFALSRGFTETQATWARASASAAWSTAGARGSSDRTSTAIAELTPTATGAFTITFNAAGIAAVQKWVNDPATNFGFAFDSANNADGLAFDSSEASTVTNRPRLQVTWAAPTGTGTGLTAQYFNGTALAGSALLTRTDATVNFNWGSASPGGTVPADNFSARWTGQVQPLFTQTYTFFTQSDDGVRLWVNGQKLIDNWSDHGSTENSGAIALTAGQKYDLRLEYYEKGGGAVAQLSWSSSSQGKQVIPQTQLSPTAAPPTGGGFVHPGLLITTGQIAFVKQKIAQGAEPWTSQLAKAKGNGTGIRDPNRVPQPVATMICGNGGSTTDVGCTASRQDALAAYTLALLWVYTGEQRYADGAKRILNAYASTLKEIRYVSTDNNTFNGPLQAAWLSEFFPRAAELIRHTNAGWSQAEAQAFGTFLKNVMLPRIGNNWFGGTSNWNLSMAHGNIAIGVYTDDRALYDRGIAQWREIVPQVFHLKTDGNRPIVPDDYALADGSWNPTQLQKAWWGASEWGTDRTNGLSAEFCRDFGHAQMSLASATYGAEIALIQGLDLYAEQQSRLVAAHEYLAGYSAQFALPNNKTSKNAVGSWLCDGEITVQHQPTWEVLYNHFNGRRGRALPNTLQVLPMTRQYGAFQDLQMAWETLTHAGTGSAGR